MLLLPVGLTRPLRRKPRPEFYVCEEYYLKGHITIHKSISQYVFRKYRKIHHWCSSDLNRIEIAFLGKCNIDDSDQSADALIHIERQA